MDAKALDDAVKRHGDHDRLQDQRDSGGDE